MAWAGLVEGEASAWEGVSASAEALAGVEALVEDSAEGGGQRLTPVTTGWLLPTRGMATPTTPPIANGAGTRFFATGHIPTVRKMAMVKDRAGVLVLETGNRCEDSEKIKKRR